MIAHMSGATPPRNFFFPLAAFCSALFIVTIFALVASVFGDPRAPLARLFDRYAGCLFAGEVAAVLITGFLALFVDRRETKRTRNDSLKAPDEQEPPG
jgi:membrane protein DedA with SNARE-associated domain